MKKTFTLILSLSASLVSVAQTTIGNAGFENWGGSGSSAEPTSWNSNKTGTGLASSGPQTCFQETTSPHSGTSCVRVETKYYIIAVVNGNVTTGVVEAPSSNKSEGFLSATAANGARMSFVGRPDSLVGWFKYTQATSGTGAAQEQGKVRAILHSGDYYDPETPVNSNHPDMSANKIGDALYLTAMANQSTWKRFSVPFNYVNGSVPSYIMINITSSNNQNTVAPSTSTGNPGSKLWVDDLDVIYNNPTALKETQKSNFNVYAYDKTIYVDMSNRDNASILSVLDITGKVILTQSLEKNKMNTIQLPSSVNSGMYLYQVTGSETQKTGKIIVQ